MTSPNDESRYAMIIIDVGNVQNSTELHSLLKKRLEFPEFYGMNWDAFWDAITGLVELPETIKFEGWCKLEENLPGESQLLADSFEKFNKLYPALKSTVIYS